MGDFNLKYGSYTNWKGVLRPHWYRQQQLQWLLLVCSQVQINLVESEIQAVLLTRDIRITTAIRGAECWTDLRLFRLALHHHSSEETQFCHGDLFVNSLDEKLTTHGPLNGSPTFENLSKEEIELELVWLSSNCWMRLRNCSLSGRMAFPPPQSETASSTCNVVPKPPTAAYWTCGGRRCQMQSIYMLILRIRRSSSALSSQYTDHPDQSLSLSSQRRERTIMENVVNTSVLVLQILHCQQRGSGPDPLETTRQLQPHSTMPSSILIKERILVRAESLHESIRMQDQWHLTHSTTS